MKPEEKNKEKLAALVFFLLIIIVVGVTFFRPLLMNKNKKASQSDNTLSEYSKCPRFSPEEIQQKIKNQEKVYFLDIRNADDFWKEHIIDSVSTPFETLEKLEVDEVRLEGSVVIVNYDKTDARTFQAVKILSGKVPKEKIAILDGGMIAWKKSRGKTISLGDPALFVDQAKINFISPEELKELIKNNSSVFILDVRSSEDFTDQHVPNAYNIPFKELEKRRNELPFEKETIVYGENELQGFQSGAYLYDLNFFTVRVLKGGFSAWKEKGLEVQKEN